MHTNSNWDKLLHSPEWTGSGVINSPNKLSSSKGDIILEVQHTSYCLQVGYSIVITPVFAFVRRSPYWWIHAQPLFLPPWLSHSWSHCTNMGWVAKGRGYWPLLDESLFLPELSVPPLPYLVWLKNLHTIWLLIWSFHTPFFFRMPCLWLSNLVLSKLWPSS